jgi:hypothetical protein
MIGDDPTPGRRKNSAVTGIAMTLRSPPHLDRSFARALAAIALLVTVGACAFGDRGGLDPSPHAVLAVAYENLADRYLDPVHIDGAATAGLEHLNNLDADLTVTRARGVVRLAYAGRDIVVRPEPGPHDALGWAWLSADMIEAARQASAKFKRHPIDDVYDAVLSGTLAGLDPYTRYASPAAARRARE